jgi:hypothetical protein
MAQYDFGTIDPNTKSGTALATDLNSYRNAVNSMHSGAAQPSYITAGMMWVDTTSADYEVKLYDGAQSITVAIIDATNNVARVAVDPAETSYITATTSAQIRHVIASTNIFTTRSTGIQFNLASPVIADSNNNELISFTTTASAVNQINVANAATGGAVDLSAVGTDTNISLTLTPKGTGNVGTLADLLIGTTNANPATANVTGISLGISSSGIISGNASANNHRFGRSNDGNVMGFYSAGDLEGTISISGTTTSYNGGHLSRWAQLADNSRPDLLKGTVMSNLDQMSNWSGEDNEQLNCVQVSTAEGDANVAGVFVAWDSDDDGYNDILLAMTGDMVIRIAADTTVQRGDLLMSAGDGTAKPQGDDIVRSKTIAKVTSTHVSHNYADGSYAVPCVLMAC